MGNLLEEKYVEVNKSEKFEIDLLKEKLKNKEYEEIFKDLKNIFSDENFKIFFNKHFEIENRQKIIDTVTALIGFIEIKDNEDTEENFLNIKEKINKKISELLLLLNKEKYE